MLTMKTPGMTTALDQGQKVYNILNFDSNQVQVAAHDVQCAILHKCMWLCIVFVSWSWAVTVVVHKESILFGLLRHSYLTEKEASR